MQNKSQHFENKTIKLIECTQAKDRSQLWLKASTKRDWIRGNNSQISKCSEITWLSAKTGSVKVWKSSKVKRSSKEK